MNSQEFVALVKKLIGDGADPNDLCAEFEQTVSFTKDWVLWGDGTWRSNTVCSKCGSSYDPGLHRKQPNVSTIPFKQWENHEQIDQTRPER